MSNKNSRTNSSLEYFNGRLDEVRMSSHERLRAKASLARAEAATEAAFRVIRLVKRLLTTLIVHPVRRWADLAG